jgi:ribosomal 50S subunit-associated protein YjgA (DUF615 family)
VQVHPTRVITSSARRKSAIHACNTMRQADIELIRALAEVTASEVDHPAVIRTIEKCSTAIVGKAEIA